MVKHVTITPFLPLLAVLLTGCLTVDSREAFYTDEVRTPAPELHGEWFSDNDETWLFTGDRTMTLRVYADDGRRDSVVVPFKVAGVTFIDIAGGPDHLHTVYAASIQGRTLNLTTLDLDWLTNSIAHGDAHLPPPVRDAQSNLVFTASSAAWVQFLQDHAMNTNAFHLSSTLLKSPNANFVPACRKQP